MQIDDRDDRSQDELALARAGVPFEEIGAGSVDLGRRAVPRCPLGTVLEVEEGRCVVVGVGRSAQRDDQFLARGQVRRPRMIHLGDGIVARLQRSA
ncbi:MAG: hypothetical protein ACTHNU_01800 [Gaiellales bacterium]